MENGMGYGVGNCLIFKHYCYWLMLTYFLCFLGGKSVFKLENALFQRSFSIPSTWRGERFNFMASMQAVLSLTGCKSITCKDRMQVYNRHSYFSCFFLLLMTLLLNIGLNYKLKNMLQRMYNRRLCMYIQYVKKPLFLYFKCSKLIKSNNYHVIFYFFIFKMLQ